MLDKARDYDLSSLRECVGGGEPLLPAIFNEWKEITGVEMRTAWAFELLHIFISASGDDIKPGAIGKAVQFLRSVWWTNSSKTSSRAKRG